MEPIILPIEDVLDLHQFRPKEIPSLLAEYLSECRKAQIYSVRIIHGKGQGILKNMVLQHLKKNHLVLSFKDAPIDGGGWGATLVELKK
ncbi:MAG: Smr/MutS family protein [Desulfobacterales bacterium]